MYLTFGLVTVLLVYQLNNLNQKYNSINDDFTRISQFIGDDTAVKGLSCGLLDPVYASSVVGEDNSLLQSYTNRPLKHSNSWFWEDNCRYVSESDNSIYLELYIETYETDKTAEFAFTESLQIVNDNTDLGETKYGSKLIYDAGVIYLLQNNRVVKVSIGIDESEELREKALETLRYILDKSTI